jgi:short-subunit dehydrogenase
VHAASSVLITGASSGIGWALARHYAAPGVRLALAGRDETRLEQIAALCREAGAVVTAAKIEITDRERMAAWVKQTDQERPVDLAIACAGISGESTAPGEDPEYEERVYRVNVLGTLNTISPLLPAMRARRRGQIGIVASVRGFRGLARAPAYCGSKAALIAQGSAWRDALAGAGVGVSVICPGYVYTPLAARHGRRLPFAISAEDAARRIAAGLAANRARIIFPWPMPLVAWIFRALPSSWTRLLDR